MQHAPASVTVIAVKALVRDLDAAARSAIAGRDLVRLVGELSPASVVAVTTTSGPRRGRISIEFELRSSESTLAQDLASILEGVATLGRPRIGARPAPTISDAWELSRTRFAPLVVDEPEQRSYQHPEYPAAGPRRVHSLALMNTADSLESLLQAMAQQPGLMLRSIFAAASEVERVMVADELHAPAAGADLSVYQGAVVRARTIIAATSGPVPPLVRARLRQAAMSVQLAPLSGAEAQKFWSDAAAILVGHALPDGTAMALVRFPAAGERSVIGMSTVRPAVRVRALDPLPAAPANPLHLGKAFAADGRIISATMDAMDLCRHAFIEGKSGSGKTTLILALFRALTRAGYAVTYLDPHGDGARAASAYATEAGAPRTLSIRHSDLAHPVRLNLMAERDPELRAQSLSEFLELIKAMFDPKSEGIVGPRFLRWFSLIAEAVYARFGDEASLSTVGAVASDLSRVRSLAKSIVGEHPELAHRLTAEVGNLSGDDANTMTSWAMSKFQPFLAGTAMREILGTGVDSVDVTELIDSETSLIVDLGMPRLGVQSARVLGALWLLKHWIAMGRRSNPERPRIILVDEAHLFTFGVLPAMLAEARKFGIGIVIATQHADGLSQALAEAVEANCSSMMSLRTGVRGVAAASARLGGWSHGDLLRMPDLTAATVLSRDGVPTEPFTLTVDLHARVKRAGWTAASVQKAADKLVARSNVALWLPWADAKVLSDSEVVERIQSPVRQRPTVVPPPPAAVEGDSEQSFLDWWTMRADTDPTDSSPAHSPQGAS